MAINFDGDARLIALDPSTSFYTAEYIYSRWIDWANTGDNGKYLPAFRVVGGDNLGGGAKAPVFVFLRNDFGWRIKKPEADLNVTISGNLVREDPGLGLDIAPDGAFSPTLTISLSSVAGVDVVGAMRAEIVDGGFDLFQAASLILSAVAGKGGPDGQGGYRYRDASDTKDRIVAAVDGSGVRTSVTLDAD